MKSLPWFLGLACGAVAMAAPVKADPALGEPYRETIPAYHQGSRDIFREYEDLTEPPSLHPDPARTNQQATDEAIRLKRKLAQLDGLLFGFAAWDDRIWYPAAEEKWRTLYPPERLPTLWEFELYNQAGYEHLPDHRHHRIRVLRDGIALYQSGGIPWYRSHQGNFAGGGVMAKDSGSGIDGVLTPGPARDRYIRWYTKLAVEMRAAKIPLVFRPFHELTGGWFWWGADKLSHGNTPEKLIRMWREVHDIFQFHGATNVLWCWNIAQEPSNVAALRRFYPGDDTVDILSFEMRYDGDAIPRQHLAIIEGLMQLNPDKPILTAEHAPAPNAKVIASWQATFRPYPRYKGWLYWAPGKYHFTIDRDSPAGLQQAYRDFLHDPRTIAKGDWLRYFNAPFPPEDGLNK